MILPYSETERRKVVGRWLNRLRFKSLWESYHYGELTSDQYFTRCFIMARDIRKAVGFTSERAWLDIFKEGWELLRIYSGSYRIAYGHMLKMIYIDW